jgi:ADP-heptose:LPS heptosyltransferase
MLVRPRLLHRFRFSGNHRDADYAIQRDEQYLVSPGTAASIARKTGLECQADGFFETASEPTSSNSNSGVAVIRHGAFGDLLFLTPLIREIAGRSPDNPITVVAAGSYGKILTGNPYIDHVATYPLAVTDAKGFSVVLHMEYGDPSGGSERTLHLAQVYARESGIELTSLGLDMFVPKSARAQAAELLASAPRPLVGIQVRASNGVRSYPRDLVRRLAEQLERAGLASLLFDGPGAEPMGLGGRCLETCLMTPQPDILVAAGLVQACNVVVGPDSAITHLAVALGRPTVALFGPFPWELRVPARPNVSVINPNLACSPCFHHTRSGAPFPVNGPCAATARCEVLATIEPQSIVQAVQQLIARHPGALAN